MLYIYNYISNISNFISIRQIYQNDTSVRAGEHAGGRGGIHRGFLYGFRMVSLWLSYVFDGLPMVFLCALPMVFFLYFLVLFAVCKCIPIVSQGLSVMYFIFP